MGVLFDQICANPALLLAFDRVEEWVSHRSWGLIG
jgi:hypothetical protein